MSRTRSVGLGAVLALVAGLVGCEPESILEARAQLGGPADTLVLTLPLFADTLVLADAFAASDTASTATGAFGLRSTSQSFDFGVAEALTFDNLSFEAFSVGYDGLLQTDEISRTFTVSADMVLPPPGPAAALGPGPERAPPFDSDTIRFSAGNGAIVVGAEIASGIVVRVIDNASNCDLTTGVTLRDASGQVAAFPDVPIAAGASVTDSLDLGGVVILDFVEPDPTASFTGCGGPPAGSLSVGFTFLPLSMASVTLADVDETFVGEYAPFDTRFDGIDSLGVERGTLRLDITSRAPMDLVVDLTMEGLLESGVPLQRTIVIPGAPPNGLSVEGVDLNLVDAVLLPSEALVRITARATADTTVLTPAVTSQAADVSVSGTLNVAFLAGVLDAAATPELAHTVEVADVIQPTDIDFDELEDVVRGVTINDAQLTFLLQSGLSLPFSLDTFVVGVTRTDMVGQALRETDGSFAFEMDSDGQPLLIPLALPGSAVLPVPAGGSIDLTLQAAPLVDRVVQLLLDDVPAALVAVGTVIIGDGTAARIAASDSVSMAIDLVVGFDFILPDTGLTFDLSEAVEGARLDSADVEEATSRLLDGKFVAELENGFPVALTIDIAIAPRALPDADDVFAAEDRVEVATVAVRAATVDPLTGYALAPTIDTVSLSLTGSDVRVLLGDSTTVAVRVRVRGDAAAEGRARLRASDRLLIRLSSVVRALLGGQ